MFLIFTRFSGKNQSSQEETELGPIPSRLIFMVRKEIIIKVEAIVKIKFWRFLPPSE
jgi:hypothetical protein